MSGQTIVLRAQSNKDFAIRFVTGLKVDADHPLEIEIRQHRKKRSLDQNALYWKILGIISAETGNDPTDLHEFFKREYAEPRRVTVKGQDFEVHSTAKMRVDEMTKYLDRIFAFAAHEGILLPEREQRAA